LVIGDGVTVGHRAVLHGCAIGDGCLVGMGAIVMDRAVLASGVMLAAGSLVPPGKRLASGFLYRGSPARKARELTMQERDYLAYSADYYVRLAARHRVGLGDAASG
jgi:carbonic anhydrase/acetyltransferase-like protein (isoleucine patch superfamily)